MIQANISQTVKWDRKQYRPTLKLYQQSSAPLWSQNDIVIWPEAAIPSFYQQAEPFLSKIGKQAKQHKKENIYIFNTLRPYTKKELNQSIVETTHLLKAFKSRKKTVCQ